MVYFSSCIYCIVAVKYNPCKTASVRNWMANKSFREGTEILTALWTFTEIKLVFDGSWYIIITVRFPSLSADSLTSWPIGVIDLRSLSLVALKCRTHQRIYQECISPVYWNEKVENKHKSVFCTCIIQHLETIHWAFEVSFTTYRINNVPLAVASPSFQMSHYNTWYHCNHDMIMIFSIKHQVITIIPETQASSTGDFGARIKSCMCHI